MLLLMSFALDLDIYLYTHILIILSECIFETHVCSLQCSTCSTMVKSNKVYKKVYEKGGNR